MKKLIVLIGLFFITPTLSHSQTYEHPWALGFHIGISEYNGDGVDAITSGRNDQYWNHMVGLIIHPSFGKGKIHSKRSKCPRL